MRQKQVRTIKTLDLFPSLKGGNPRVGRSLPPDKDTIIAVFYIKSNRLPTNFDNKRYQLRALIYNPHVQIEIFIANKT